MQEKKYLKLKEEKLRGQEHWIEGSEEVGLENESKKRNKEGNQEKKRKKYDWCVSYSCSSMLTPIF